MFAVLKTGGKQYRVSENDKIRVEKIEYEEGSSVEFDEVLMVHDGSKSHIGDPVVKGAKVIAVVERQMRDRKVIVFKKKRRQNYRRKKGHRQYLTVLKIRQIVVG